jgi:hypothetical protein
MQGHEKFFLPIHSIHRAQQPKIPVMAIVGEEVIKKVLPFIPSITLQVQTLRIPSAKFKKEPKELQGSYLLAFPPNGTAAQFFFSFVLGPACSDTVEPIAGVSKHFRTGKEKGPHYCILCQIILYICASCSCDLLLLCLGI